MSKSPMNVVCDVLRSRYPKLPFISNLLSSSLEERARSTSISEKSLRSALKDGDNETLSVIWPIRLDSCDDRVEDATEANSPPPLEPAYSGV